MKNEKLKIPKLARMAEEALKKAVRQTLEDHKRTGDPVVIGQNGKVARFSAASLLKGQ